MKEEMHIENKIRERLKEKGQSAVWLAEQIGCHPNNVYKILDSPNMDFKRLYQISEILDTDFYAAYISWMKINK